MNNVKCILIDVDGTLTDGKIYMGDSGEEFKVFNVKDGMGIIKAIENNIVIGFITGRGCKALENRANSLGVKYLYQNNNKKVDIIKEIIEKENISKDEVLFIGDDINDFNAMVFSGHTACPRDASDDIINISQYISKRKGGDGAVRDIIEYVLKEQNLWNINKDVVSYYKK